MSARTRASARRRQLLTVLGVVLVAVLVLGEVLLVRSYQKTSRTTRDFQRSTRVSTGLANAQAETLLLAQTVAGLDTGDTTLAVLVGRAALERQISVVQRAAHDAPGAQAHLRAIRADVARFDVLFTAAYGPGVRVRPGTGRDRMSGALTQLGHDIKRAVDDEQAYLSAGLAASQDEGPRTTSGWSRSWAPSPCSWPQRWPSSSGARSAATSPARRTCSKAPRRASSSSSSSSPLSCTRSRFPRTAVRRAWSTSARRC